MEEDLSFTGVERLRRSVAMLTPFDRGGLSREAALKVLAEMQRLQLRNRRHVELFEQLRTLLREFEARWEETWPTA